MIANVSIRFKPHGFSQVLCLFFRCGRCSPHVDFDVRSASHRVHRCAPRPALPTDDNLVVAVLLVLHVFNGLLRGFMYGQISALLSASPPHDEELARRGYLLLFTYACGRTKC